MLLNNVERAFTQCNWLGQVLQLLLASLALAETPAQPCLLCSLSRCIVCYKNYKKEKLVLYKCLSPQRFKIVQAQTFFRVNVKCPKEVGNNWSAKKVGFLKNVKWLHAQLLVFMKSTPGQE